MQNIAQTAEQSVGSQLAFQADVQAACNGDAEAFGRLYGEIYPSLYRVARYSLRTPEDAADAVSEAVLDAFASIRRLHNAEAFRAWMFRILTAKIKRIYRSYAQPEQPWTEARDASCAFDYAGTELHIAMAQLHEADRLLLSLQVLGGYQSQELAEMVGGTAVGIRTRLMRIRQRLRLMLEPEKG